MAKKSITTRFKVTPNKKVLKRKIGQCHFKAKKSSKQLYRKQGNVAAPSAIRKRVLKDHGSL